MHLIKISCVLIFFLHCSVLLMAQHENLPKGFAPGEQAAMPEYIQNVQNQRTRNTPPPGPVRTMAEWEELDGVVITWAQFPNILAEIIRASRLETTVYIVTNNAGGVSNFLVSKGIDISSNVQFVDSDFDSIWVRDYGPNTAYLHNVDSLVIIDWIYNRPRYADDLVPYGIADHLSIPIYGTATPPDDLVNTGGNFMVDGMGKGFSSELVLEENGPFNTYGMSNHSEAEVDSIMGEFMGLGEYIKMEVLPYDAIHHIDMHMKLLDERTLLVGEYPQGIADGPQIEANIQYIISNFETAWNREFKVVRMPMPPDRQGRYPHQGGAYRTYTNSLIVNKTILIPTYQERYDTTALRIWGDLMPGYQLVGIDCNDIIPLSGALHCITKEIGTNDPMQISHARLPDVLIDQNADYLVEALIRHKSGIQSAQVFYSSNLDDGFTAVEMTLASAEEDLWQAYIPMQELGSRVYYYIKGVAESGKEQVRPMPAPAGYFDFKIEAINTGVAEIPNAPDIQMAAIYPNPASAITAIPIEVRQSTSARVTLKDVSGRLVAVIFEGTLAPGLHNQFLMAQRYPAGVYFVELSADGIRKMQKLVID